MNVTHWYKGYNECMFFTIKGITFKVAVLLLSITIKLDMSNKNKSLIFALNVITFDLNCTDIAHRKLNVTQWFQLSYAISTFMRTQGPHMSN